MSLAVLPSESTAAKSRIPALLEVTWTDPVSGRRGYLVIDRLVRGVCSGGLRMREGCTLEEVRGLAAGMTLKEGLHFRPGNRYVPLGGAKGGIDVSPQDPDARGILARFLQGVRPLLEHNWTAGEDLGLHQQMLDEVIAEMGLRSSVQAVYPLLEDEAEASDRLDAALAITVGGIPLVELVGGLGVAESVLTALDSTGRPHRGTRVLVQGFGSMGGATARYLAQAGLLIVGIADTEGVVVNPRGLDVEALLSCRDAFGCIDRSKLGPGDTVLPREAWLGVDVDVLVPAAVSYCITPENQSMITANLIVEAANMPVLPEAERLLAERGVKVVPDFVANSGANAWWWWTLFGDIGADAMESDAKIRGELRRIVAEVIDRAGQSGVTLREAAMAMVEDNLRDIEARFGNN